MRRSKYPKESEKLKKKVVRAICPQCSSLGEDRSCLNADFAQGCSVMQFIPEIIQIAVKLKRKNLKKFTESIQREICPKCFYRSQDGNCEIEDSCRLRASLKSVLSLAYESLRKGK